MHLTELIVYSSENKVKIIVTTEGWMFMKKTIKMSLIALSAVVSFNAFADYSDYEGLTCLGKQNAIQTQLSYAKKANNVYQVQGLEKALNEVLTYCTDKKLEKKYKEKISKQMDDVKDRQYDLEKAKMDGRPDKIAKQQTKLQKDEYELKEAREKLDAFYKELKAQK